MGGVSHALNIGPGKFGHDGDDDGHVDVDGDKHDNGGDDDQFIWHYQQHKIITIIKFIKIEATLDKNSNGEKVESSCLLYYVLCIDLKF